MPAGYDYALCADARSQSKPFAFQDIHGLVRHILRGRSGRALQLKDDRLMVRGETAPRQVVAIYAEDQVGNRAAFIGYAWLKGRNAEALRAALAAAEPVTRVGVVRRRRAA